MPEKLTTNYIVAIFKFSIVVHNSTPKVHPTLFIIIFLFADLENTEP